LARFYVRRRFGLFVPFVPHVTLFLLQTFPEGYFNSYRDEKTRKTNVLTLMKKAIKLREEWESLRILLDVVRQREKRKLALLKLQQEVHPLPSALRLQLPTPVQIVEEEVAVGWRTVQKARVTVAAKWKVRPVKLQAVRAHHNFRSSSGRYFHVTGIWFVLMLL
jgi:hypothetical protein